MANLAELRDLLQTLARDGGTAKVSFYYVGEDGVALRNGSILVDAGRQAYLDHEGLPAAQAVDAIMGLKLIKIASLQMTEVRPAPGQQAVALQDLIAYLDAPAPPAPAAAPAAAPAPPPAPVATAAPAPEPLPTATTEREALPSIDVKAEALRLLEPLFGVSAIRKVDEFAIAHPPMQHPHEFLLLCQKHTAIMLGAPKAEALFRPLYDLLASERLQHRRR
jgi:hypothetical protein